MEMKIVTTTLILLLLKTCKPHTAETVTATRNTLHQAVTDIIATHLGVIIARICHSTEGTLHLVTGNHPVTGTLHPATENYSTMGTLHPATGNCSTVGNLHPATDNHPATGTHLPATGTCLPVTGLGPRVETEAYHPVVTDTQATEAVHQVISQSLLAMPLTQSWNSWKIITTVNLM